jgi:hypothetical protein
MVNALFLPSLFNSLMISVLRPLQVQTSRLGISTTFYLCKDAQTHSATDITRPEAVYRQAEKEWKDFIDAFIDVLIEADPDIHCYHPKMYLS